MQGNVCAIVTTIKKNDFVTTGTGISQYCGFFKTSLKDRWEKETMGTYG